MEDDLKYFNQNCRMLQPKVQKPEHFPHQRLVKSSCATCKQRVIGSVYLRTRCVF